MSVTNWYQEFQSAKTDGSLPVKGPARAMRYKRAIIWQVDVTTLGIAPVKAKGSWTVEIYSQAGGRLIFKQKVTIQLLFVSMGTGVGLAFFTWGYTKDEFDTTIVAGNVTDKTNIGQYVQGGTALSEQGIAIPGGGSDMTNFTAIVQFDWLSPIYLFKEPNIIPRTAVVKVTRDAWSFGPSTVEYGWAFDEASPIPLTSLIDAMGSMTVGVARTGKGREGSGDVGVTSAWPTSEFQETEFEHPVPGGYPTFHELADGRIIASVLDVEGVFEYETLTSRWNWRRLEYDQMPGEEGSEKAAHIFSRGVNMPSSIKIDDDTRLHIAVRGSKIVWSMVDSSGPTPESTIGVIPDSDAGIPSIEISKEGYLFIIGGRGVPIFQSKSIPPQWAKVGPVS